MSKADSVGVLALLEQQGHLRGLERPKVRLRKISLPGVDLSGARLMGTDLSHADLSGACLENADLTNANLNGANLAGARLNGATLHKARLREANLAGAELREARLGRCQLHGAILKDARLDDAQLVDADLERVDARGASFRGAALTRASLAGARLDGADLEGADLEESFLEHAELVDVRLKGAKLARSNLVGIVLRVPEGLSGTDLRDVDLADATIQDTSFDGADLAGAVLDQVTCENVSFQGAVLERTDFQGVRGLAEEDLEAVRAGGGVVDALFFERAFAFIKGSRRAQILLAVTLLLSTLAVVFYFTDPSYRPVDSLMEDAQTLRDQDRAEEALSIYDQLLERVQGHASQMLSVLSEKAETLMELGRAEEAAKVYGKIVVLTEDDRGESVAAQLKQAEALAEAGKGERAIALIRAIAEDDTNSPKDVARALLALSRTYQKLGYEDRAVEIFQETMKRFPHDPEVAFDVNLQMGEVYLERRQYHQAAQLIEKLAPLARDDSQKVSLLILEARMYDAMGDRDRSLDTFETLIKRYPTSADVSPEVKMDLAQLMVDKGEYDWAARVYKDILARARDPLLKSQAQLAYGTLLKRVGRTDEALKLFRLVRRQAVNNQELQGSSRLEEAETLAAMQRYDEAFALLDEAVESSEPGLAASALLRRGQLLAETGRLDDASKVFRQVIDTFSNQAEVVVTARMDLARLEATRGNASKAIPIYEALLQDPAAEPFRTHLLNDLGHTYADLRRPDDAERVFRQLLQFKDDEEAQANARFGLARLALARGDLEEAAALYQHVVETTSDINLKATALDSLARMYSDAGEIGPAIDAYQQILGLVPPRHDAAFAARQGMAQLFQRQGELAKAESLYRATLDQATRADVRAATLLALGSLYLDQQKPSQAIQMFQQVRDTYSGVPDADFQARMGLAEAYRLQGKTDKAITTLRAAASTAGDPRQASQALEQLAQLYDQTGDAEKALQVGRQILELAGEDPEVQVAGRLAVAAGLRDQGDVEGALKIYEELEKNTQDRNLRLTILDAQAQACADVGRLDDAARAYQAIIDGYQDNLDIYHNAMMGLASVRRSQGRLDEAASLYEQVARDTVDQGMRVWALESVAQVYTQAGKPDKARQALALAGKNQETLPTQEDLLAQANAARARGDLEQALETYQQVAQGEGDPGDRAWAMVYAAQVLAEMERSDEALATFQKVMERFPAQHEQVLTARLGAAGIFRARNQLLEAAARYEETARGDSFPDYRVTAALAAAEIYLEQKLPEKAQTLYQDLLERFPDRPEAVQNARLGLAEIDRVEGNVQEALTVFEQLRSSSDETVRGKAIAGLVRCYASLGDRETARELYQTLKARYPDESSALAQTLTFLRD